MEANAARWHDDASIHDDQDMPRGPQRPGDTVLASLRDRINAGEWEPGDALPSNVALADHYGVARMTVMRALRVLQDEGLVRIVPRWGTFRA
jgi:DNA-binding GntR family transcriptional regulator